MATGDDRKLPIVTKATDDPADRRSVVEALRQVYEMVYALEGRIGGVALRDNLNVAGSGTFTGGLSTSSALTVDDYFQMNERGFNAAGVRVPSVSAAGSGRMYFDSVLNKYQVSENGGAYTNLVVPAVTLPTAACRVYNNANISLNDDTNTLITFNSERFDTDSMHSTVSATSKITFNTAGKYLIGAHGYVGADGGGLVTSWQIKLNNTTFIGYGPTVYHSSFAGTNGVSTIWDCAAGDYAEVYVYMNSFSNTSLNLNSASAYSPEFWAVKIMD